MLNIYTLFSVAGRFPDFQYKSFSFLFKMFFFSLPLLLFWNPPCVYFVFLITIWVPYLSDTLLMAHSMRASSSACVALKVPGSSPVLYLLLFAVLFPLYCMVCSIVLAIKSPHNSIIPAPYKKPFYTYFFQK